MTQAVNPELELAKRFHEAYERLAPDFGYETRKETRDFDQGTPNGKLMIAVCGELLNCFDRPSVWRKPPEMPERHRMVLIHCKDGDLFQARRAWQPGEEVWAVWNRDAVIYPDVECWAYVSDLLEC